jgi:hypothetical protein
MAFDFSLPAASRPMSWSVAMTTPENKSDRPAFFDPFGDGHHIVGRQRAQACCPHRFVESQVLLPPLHRSPVASFCQRLPAKLALRPAPRCQLHLINESGEGKGTKAPTVREPLAMILSVPNVTLGIRCCTPHNSTVSRLPIGSGRNMGAIIVPANL